MKLPSFRGDEQKSPFLNYPVWREQWDILIDDYDEKLRIVLYCIVKPGT